ncbi:MAG TPA: diguanylate cyclase [Terriglobales bacterium]|nr:diguanylate cyclase [Terriglobales bacterium]
MNSIFVGIVVVPGITALVLLFIFTYLYQQSREGYFRAWQAAWASYTLYYVAIGALIEGHGGAPGYFAAKSFQLLTVLIILASTRLVDGEQIKLRWYDVLLFAGGTAFNVYLLGAHRENGRFVFESNTARVELEVVLAVLLLIAAVRFFRFGRQKDFVGFRLVALALTIWAMLMSSRQFHDVFGATWLGSVGHILGPLPQMLLGLAMVIVLYEHERRMVQENTLYFSTLDVDNTHLVSPAELTVSLQKLLERLSKLLTVEQTAICAAKPWRTVVPTTSIGFSPEFLKALETSGASEYLIDMAYRRGGIVTFKNIATMSEPLPAGPQGLFTKLQEVLNQNGISSLTAISLQTRDRNFGVVLFPHPNRAPFGPSQIRLLLGLAMQIGMTLENHIALQETQRRTREYELMTQMGQVISSHLDADQVLQAIHREIGLLVDTHTFYIAFSDEHELRFELEVIEGEVQPKRSRKLSNGLSEYVIRTGQPLLVISEMEQMRQRIGATFVPGRPAKSFCGVPIFMQGKSVGIMAALNYERDHVYTERDVELLQTASGQVAVAVENARLFEEQQRRARSLAFLNTVSKSAISSQDAEQMLDEIVTQIQQNFQLDHIGIGVLDYTTKDIEIKAEAGTTSLALGKRVPLGVGIMGKVARSNEMILLQRPDTYLTGILKDARSVLCLPLNYGETQLGVLNIESRKEHAFSDQDVLILRTLADLIAAALHNVFVFQKMQQQSITDGLTGIKTRRFFLEAVQGEWKRASRSGRPFSVVMIDLDKFKEVNDGMGHLEGDLVLARVGRLLEQKCRQSNVVARYGGDEFVILMPETGIEQSQILSERLRLWLATDPMLNERHITGSFGVASFPLHGSTVEDIMRVADAGMYVSKHAGGNRVSTAEEFEEGETIAVQRQLVASYIEGFLQRENMGPEAGEELVTTLKKMCAGLQDDPEPMKEAIIVLSRAAEAHEGHNAGHGTSVARYAEAMARELGVSSEDIADIVFAAQIHDVGKLIIPERLLGKPSSLTEDEYHIIKMHPVLSAEIVACVPGSERVQEIVRHHHERYDGRGYPDGLRAAEIPLASRILNVADAYTSMVTHRPFAEGKTVSEAVEELELHSGRQFDPDVVGVFLQMLKGESARKGKITTV